MSDDIILSEAEQSYLDRLTRDEMELRQKEPGFTSRSAEIAIHYTNLRIEFWNNIRSHRFIENINHPKKGTHDFVPTTE